MEVAVPLNMPNNRFKLPLIGWVPETSGIFNHLTNNYTVINKSNPTQPVWNPFSKGDSRSNPAEPTRPVGGHMGG